MKNLLNCHSIGLHSFPVSFENGLYKRIFYADYNHNLWKTDPLELAIHPHQVDIKITVLEGILFNPLFEVSSNPNDGTIFQKYQWDSVILNGKGGFRYLGSDTLKSLSYSSYKKGESTIMKSCEMHTVSVSRGYRAVWLIEESVPICEYFPISYSNHDLTKWNQQDLYLEVNDEVKDFFIRDYLKLI